MKHRSQLASIGGLGVTRLVCRLMALASGLLVSRVLGPERLGQLAYGNLLISLAPFLSLGFAEVLIRRSPRLRSAGQSISGLRFSVMRGMLGLLPVYLGLLLLAQGLLPRGILPDGRLFALFLLAFTGNYLFKLYHNDLTGRQCFRQLALAQLSLLASRSLLIVAFVLLLPEPARILGLYLGMGLSFLLVDGFLHWRDFSRGGGAAREPLVPLLREGAPIALASLAAMALLVGDRILVSPALTPLHKGLFEQAVLLREALLIVPSVLMTVMIPSYSARSGPGDERQGLLLESLRQNQFLGVVGSLVFGLLILQMPWVIRLLLPAYVEGLPLFHWTGIAVLPLVIGYLPISFLISQGRSLQLAVISGGVLALLLFADGWLVGQGLEGELAFRAVQAGCVAYLLQAVLLLVAQVRGSGGPAVIQPLFFTLAGPVLTGAVLVRLGHGGEAAGLGQAVGGAALNSVLLLLALLPLLAVFEWRTGRLRAVLSRAGKRKTDESSGTRPGQTRGTA
jgi:O-antigen/teichoic acid export membrane protein